MALIGCSLGDLRSNIHLYSTYTGRRGDVSAHLLCGQGVDQQMRERRSGFSRWRRWTDAGCIYEVIHSALRPSVSKTTKRTICTSKNCKHHCRERF